MTEPAEPADWSVLVLTGGRSSRLGQDKARATVAGRSLLDHVLVTIPVEVPCIVVGPPPGSTIRPITLVTESVPDGGPVAGLASGLESVSTAVLVLLATDMPFLGTLASDLGRLVAADSAIDAAVPVDDSGRRQPLAAAYRTSAVRHALTELGPPHGRALWQLLELLRVREVPIDSKSAPILVDIDTVEDLLSARRSVSEQTRTGALPMNEWITAAAAALDIDATVVDIDVILDVAREAAHGVERPAAPVSTFLMGWAVARGMDPAAAAARLTVLAREWPTPD